VQLHFDKFISLHTAKCLENDHVCVYIAACYTIFDRRVIGEGTFSINRTEYEKRLICNWVIYVEQSKVLGFEYTLPF